MQTSLLQPTSGCAQDAPATLTDGVPEPPNPTLDDAGQIRKLMSESPRGGDSPGKLLPFEEIYRLARIQGVRMGYSINKVIEMLQSEHIRSLPAESKRAALLMALEAAGVQVDEVIGDATLRQLALYSYEATQRKQREQHEASKAEENCTIQAELDRLRVKYLARIQANLDEVAHEKEAFRKWQAKKQHETQRIDEAVAICAEQNAPADQNESAHLLRQVARG